MSAPPGKETAPAPPPSRGARASGTREDGTRDHSTPAGAQLALLDVGPARSVGDDFDPVRDARPASRTLEPEFDRPRLARQLEQVLGVMLDGTWRTLAELSSVTGAPEASVSARLREIRALGHVVERRRRGLPSGGLHEYRIARLP